MLLGVIKGASAPRGSPGVTADRCMHLEGTLTAASKAKCRVYVFVASIMNGSLHAVYVTESTRAVTCCSYPES